MRQCGSTAAGVTELPRTLYSLGSGDMVGGRERSTESIGPSLVATLGPLSVRDACNRGLSGFQRYRRYGEVMSPPALEKSEAVEIRVASNILRYSECCNVIYLANACITEGRTLKNT